MLEEECDKCGASIEYQAWTSEVVKCPQCGALYEAESEYLDSSEGTWMHWLRAVEETPPAE